LGEGSPGSEQRQDRIAASATMAASEGDPSRVPPKPVLDHTDPTRLEAAAGRSCTTSAVSVRPSYVFVATLSLLQWMTVFITVGREWFLMWQSMTWNDQAAAFRSTRNARSHHGSARAPSDSEAVAVADRRRRDDAFPERIEESMERAPSGAMGGMICLGASFWRFVTVSGMIRSIVSPTKCNPPKTP
jgi:hypothetical protein